MRFLADEQVSRFVVERLRTAGHCPIRIVYNLP